jgi:hypothetical protein
MVLYAARMDKTIDVVEGTTASVTTPASTRSVVVYNNSGCYCLVRIGGNDAPDGTSNADQIIAPFTQTAFHTGGASNFAFSFQSNPASGLLAIGSVKAGGICKLHFTDQFVAPYTAQLPQRTSVEGTLTRIFIATTADWGYNLIHTFTDDSYLAYAKCEILGLPTENTRLYLMVTEADNTEYAYLATKYMDKTIFISTPDLECIMGTSQQLYVPAGYKLQLRVVNTGMTTISGGCFGHAWYQV